MWWKPPPLGFVLCFLFYGQCQQYYNWSIRTAKLSLLVILLILSVLRSNTVRKASSVGVILTSLTELALLLNNMIYSKYWATVPEIKSIKATRPREGRERQNQTFVRSGAASRAPRYDSQSSAGEPTAILVTVVAVALRVRLEPSLMLDVRAQVLILGRESIVTHRLWFCCCCKLRCPCAAGDSKKPPPKNPEQGRCGQQARRVHVTSENLLMT